MINDLIAGFIMGITLIFVIMVPLCVIAGLCSIIGHLFIYGTSVVVKCCAWIVNGLVKRVAKCHHPKQ